jgi:hypothetical protein
LSELRCYLLSPNLNVGSLDREHRHGLCLVVKLSEGLLHLIHELLGLLQMPNVVKDTPLVYGRLLKHLISRQVDSKVVANFIDSKRDSLADLLCVRIDTLFHRLLGLVTHQYVASFEQLTLTSMWLLFDEEPPLSHALNALRVTHDLPHERGSLLDLDRSIRVLSHRDLPEDLLLLVESLGHPESKAELRQQESVFTDLDQGLARVLNDQAVPLLHVFRDRDLLIVCFEAVLAAEVKSQVLYLVRPIVVLRDDRLPDDVVAHVLHIIYTTTLVDFFDLKKLIKKGFFGPHNLYFGLDLNEEPRLNTAHPHSVARPQ